MFPPRTMPKRPILRALQGNTGISMTPIRALRGTPNGAMGVPDCPKGTVLINGACMPAQFMNQQQQRQYHYGRWGANPVMLPAVQHIREATTRNVAAYAGAGGEPSRSEPIRCWGPAWDQSCKVCVPLPDGSEHCTSFKVNDPFPPANVDPGISRYVRNPVPTCDADHDCKWICLPMPTPEDPNDQHCARVPIEAQLSGAFFTSSPGAARFERTFRTREGIFRRIAKRVLGR